MIWFITLTVAAAVAWLCWEAWRWELVRRVYADKEPPALTISPKHVQALRKLRFAWNTVVESGGPVVDPLTPYGSENLAADLGPIIDTRDRVAIARFHREVSSLLIWALKDCQLAEGQYPLAHLDNSAMERRLRRELASYSLPSERIASMVADLPRLEPDGHFRFTEQHRRLLRKLRLEWPDRQILPFVVGTGYPAPVVNFKRPFGDMTAFEIDMAAILGLPRPRGVDPVLDRLYREMWPALQTFVEHVEIDVVTPAPVGN